MRHCIIHFGLHKTASSSIQKFLRHELRDPRFFYPTSSELPPLRDNCHNRPLCCAFRNSPETYHAHLKEGVGLQELKTRGAWFIEHVRSAVRSEAAETLLLSAEEISNFQEDELARLLDFLRAEKLGLAAQGYVRKFKPLQESRFQQALRDPGTSGQLISLEAKHLRLFPYRKKLKMFIRLLGPAAVCFAEFSKAASSEQGVVGDFCRRAGIDQHPTGLIRENKGLSIDAVRLLCAYRQFYPSLNVGVEMMAANARLVQSLTGLEGERAVFHSSLLLRYKSEWQPDVDWVSEALGEDMLGDLYADDDTECVRSKADLFSFSPRSLDWLACASQLPHTEIKSGRPESVAAAVKRLRESLTAEAQERNGPAEGWIASLRKVLPGILR